MAKKEGRKGMEKMVTIDVLMEGPGGTLVFKPVKASPSYLRELIEASKNPVIKKNIETAAKAKNIKL